jgi:GAF domain-containing protein
MFCTSPETTSTVLAQRRQALLAEVGDALLRAEDPRGAMVATAEILARHLGADRAGFGEVEVDLDAPGRAGGLPRGRGQPRLFAQTGFAPAILGRWLREALPALEEHWYEAYGRVARTGEATRFEQGSAALGRWFDVHAFRVGEGRVGILFSDASARRDAEARLRELNDTLEHRVEECTAERNMLAKLVEMTDVMIMAVDLDYNILALNAANADEFERIYGVRPRAGDNMLELLADWPEHREQVRAGWARGSRASPPRLWRSSAIRTASGPTTKSTSDPCATTPASRSACTSS